MVHQIWLIETFLCQNTTLQKIEWQIKIEVYEDLCPITKCQQYQFVIVPINLPQFLWSILFYQRASLLIRIFLAWNHKYDIYEISIRGIPGNVPASLITTITLISVKLLWTPEFSLSILIRPSLVPGREGRPGDVFLTGSESELRQVSAVRWDRQQMGQSRLRRHRHHCRDCSRYSHHHHHHQ